MVVGLTGGVGAGKSRILAVLKEEYGAEVLMSDREAHALLERGGEGYEAVLRIFGNEFLNENGELDRRLLSGRLFYDREALKTMNGLIHPMVWRKVGEKISASQAEFIVVESAIMGREQKNLFDEIWYVYASRKNRLRRLLKNRGYDEDRSLSVMRNQPEQAEYLAMADRVIDNNGSEAEVRAALEAIWKDRKPNT